MKNQLFELRSQCLKEIEALISKLKDGYVNIHVPYCQGIKWLLQDGELGLFLPYIEGKLSPHHITDMPTDSLVFLLENLKEQLAQ